MSPQTSLTGRRCSPTIAETSKRVPKTLEAKRHISAAALEDDPSVADVPMQATPERADRRWRFRAGDQVGGAAWRHLSPGPRRSCGARRATRYVSGCSQLPASSAGRVFAAQSRWRLALVRSRSSIL